MTFWVFALTSRVRLGAWVSAGISLLLFLWAAKKRRLHYIHYFNLLFFAIASGASFVLGRSLEERLPNLVAGEYATLLIMAGSGLLEDRPFILDFLTDESRGSTHFNPSFRKICAVITYLWCLFFLLGLSLALVAMLALKGDLAKNLAPIASLALLILMTFITTLSIILSPRVFGRRLVLESHLSGTWSPLEIQPGKDLGENEYEVAVIGGGLGGLTCASLLAKEGTKVFLAEHGAQVGGYCSSLIKDGFVLNPGPTLMTGLAPGNPLNLILESLDLQEKVRFIRPSLGVVTDEHALLIPEDLEAFLEKLLGKFKGAKEYLTRFASELRSFREELNNRREPGLPPVIENLRDFHDQFYLYPLSSKWHYLSGNDLMKEYFPEPRLRKIFASLLSPFTVELEEISAYDAFFLLKELLIDGCGFPLGGLSSFSQALAGAMVEKGGVLLTHHAVESIFLKEPLSSREILGLKMEDGSQVRCRSVVMGGDPGQLFEKLLPREAWPVSYVKSLENYLFSPSAFLLMLGISGEPDMPDRVFFSTENPRRIRTGKTFMEIRNLTVSLFTRQDPSLAPKGTHLLGVKVLVPERCYHSFATDNGREGLEEALATSIRQLLRKLIPDLDDRTVFEAKFSPSWFQERTFNSMGASFGFLPTPRQHLFFRPDIKTPFPHLYLASAWARHGLGVEGALINGIMVAREISRRTMEVTGIIKA
jgi:phytoene dehydrogenase-like protein